MNEIQCTCLETPDGLHKYEKRFVGIDETNGRYGEVELQTCSRCQQIWLRYFVEYEGFSNSGRWFRGRISQSEAKIMTPESAPEYLEMLDWYFVGGSYFDGVVSKQSGKPRVDL